MLDTNILIYLIKNRPPGIAVRLNALPVDDELCMSFVTYAELLKGAERSTRKPDVLRRLESLARQVPVSYPNDHRICQHYAEQFMRLRQQARRLAPMSCGLPVTHSLRQRPSLPTTSVSSNALTGYPSSLGWIRKDDCQPPTAKPAFSVRDCSATP